MTGRIALAMALVCITALGVTAMMAPLFPHGHPSTGLMIFVIAVFVSAILSAFGLTCAIIACFHEYDHPSRKRRTAIVAVILNGLIFASITGFVFYHRILFDS